MADGSYFGFEPRLSDDPIPLPGIANTTLVCARCGCDKFTFQPQEKPDPPGAWKARLDWPTDE